MHRKINVIYVNFSRRVLVLLGFMLFLETVFSQFNEERFTFHFQEVPLRAIISAIEEETGRVFIYNSLRLNLDEKCSLNVEEASLAEVLTTLLKPYDVFFKIYGKQIVVAEVQSFQRPLKLSDARIKALPLAGDKIVVSGAVINTRGQPLEGVNVFVEHTNKGTITNANGNFSIETLPGSRLLFSHLGYEQAVHVAGAQHNLQVVLTERILSVPEIVVTALGIERQRKVLGYAYAELSGASISGSGSVNPVTSFMGRVAGLKVQPTDGGVYGSSRITIRGNSTLRENNQPVFVVDGIIMDNNIGGGTEWGGLDWGNELKSLNPDDFESLVILKGAAAAALYGSKAMNGVVLVNSKEGQRKRGVGVNVSQSFNVKDVYSGPAFQNIYGAGTVAGYATRLNDRFAPSSGFMTSSTGDPVVNSTLLSFGPPLDDRTRVKYRNGEWINYGPHPDNYLETFENGLYSNTHLSINGNKEDISFRLSYSNTYEKGVYYRNNFMRNALSGSFSYKLLEQLKAAILFSYSGSSLWNPPQAAVQQAFLTTDFGRDYDTRKWKKRYKASHGGIPSADYNDPYHQVPGHSVWFSYYENVYYRFEEGSRFIGRLNGTVAPWLSYDITGALNNFYIRREDKEPGQGFNNQGGYYGTGSERKTQQTYRFLLNGEKTLSEDSRLKLTLGAELFDSDLGGSYSNTSGGLMVPGKFSLEYSINPPETNETAGERLQTQSLFFLGEWDWKDQLFLTATGRNDWSSTLAYADGSGTLGFFYPSLSASWVFSDAFRMPSWLLFGKLRASYAQVGNGFSAFSINQSFRREGRLENPNVSIPLITHSDQYARSADIQPERKHALEAGTELSLFKNRLQFDFSWYHENTYNQIITVSVPPESGVDFQVMNAGNISNRGIEVTLAGVPVRIGDFELKASVNFTRNRNKVVELTGGVNELVLENSPNYGNARTASMAIVGKPFGVLMTDAAPLLLNNGANSMDERNGLPLLTWDEYARGAYPVRSNQKKIVGDINPDFYGGLQLDFKFRNLTLSTLFDYKIGGDIVSYSNRYGMAYGLFEGSLKYRDEEHGGITWKSSNGNIYHDGMIPRGIFEPGTFIGGQDVGGFTYREAYDRGMVEPVHASFWYYYSGNWSTGVTDDNMILENSYVGIREASLSFAFTATVLKNIRIEGGSIALFGRDLGYIYKSLPNNLNPFGTRSNRAAAAHEWGLTPYVRTIGLELKLNF